MKVSVITPCFNSAKTIPRTIRSVNAQTHRDIEHLFIDGGSNDGTQELIRKNAKPGFLLYSERDRGIYDAMNKGMALATGDIIGTLNSDDWYANTKVLEKIVHAFRSEPIDFYCSRLSYFDAHQQYSHDFGQAPVLANNRNQMSVAHPCLYLRRGLFQEVGNFDLEFRIASDYDWCLRLLKKPYRFHYEDSIDVHMSLGGASSSQNRKKFLEERAIKRRYFPTHWLAHDMIYACSLSKDFVKGAMTRAGLEPMLTVLRRIQGKRRVQERGKHD